jgi:glycosyltransferase involved in cell wall biosynthesis
MQHDIAVVMRTRDRPMLLRRALESVASQTYRNFELIVVNDGGDQTTVEALIENQSGLASVRIVTNSESVGREQAVNVGVAASDSRFVAILDDDDTWAKNYLDATAKHLDRAQDGAVAVRTEVVYEAIAEDHVVELRREILRSDLRNVTLFDTLFSNYIPPTSMVFRRSLFDEVGGWNGALPVLADWDFNLKLLMRSSIGFIDGEPLAFWHRRETQGGLLGNSVHAAAADHVETNIALRDSYLKDYVKSGAGIGELLFIAESMQRAELRSDARSDGSHRAIVEQIGALGDRLDKISEYLAMHAEWLESLDRRSGSYVSLRVPIRVRRAISALIGRAKQAGRKDSDAD